jgi:hypothetical protein
MAERRHLATGSVVITRDAALAQFQDVERGLYAFASQKRLGVIPPGTKLTPWPDELKKWDGLTPEEKKELARQAMLDGMTPLIWAANRGAAKLVKLLLARGANVNARTTQKYNAGRTALMFAGDVATVHVLLDAGADPKAADENGQHTWDDQSPAVAKLLKAAAGR